MRIWETERAQENKMKSLNCEIFLHDNPQKLSRRLSLAQCTIKLIHKKMKMSGKNFSRWDSAVQLLFHRTRQKVPKD